MTRRIVQLVTVSFVLSMFVDSAHAAAQRTFVSTTGVSNPACSLVAPCRLFSDAITATLPRGEVVVLDSGGYGGVTITQAASIIAPPGVYAGISVFSGDGITVNAGGGDTVKLRGLTLNGLGGVNGITVNTVGALEVDDLRVSGFSFRGLYFAAAGRLSVVHSVFENNGESGLHAQPQTANPASITIEYSRFDHNLNGAVLAGTAAGSILQSSASDNSSVGFLVDSGAAATLADCRASANNVGIMVRGMGNAAMIARCDVRGGMIGYNLEGPVTVEVTDSSAQEATDGFYVFNSATVAAERSTATNNSEGFRVEVGTLRLSNCTSTHNTTGIVNVPGSTVETRQNNTIRGNTTDVYAPITPFGPL